MIQIENLEFKVGRKILLDDVSWQCDPGKFSMIIGANGAGKSTLIKCISGALNSSHGQVLWDDMQLRSHVKPEKDRAVLTQHHHMAFPISVEEVIMMGRYPHFESAPRPLDLGVVERAMELFDIHDFANRNVQTLSGGERQRVHFARAWSQMIADDSERSKVLLLDEPTTYLDLKYQWKYLQIIRDETIKHGWISIGVLHDLNLVLQYADEVLLLNHGRVHISGRPESVLTSEHISECYGVQTSVENGQFVVKGVK